MCFRMFSKVIGQLVHRLDGFHKVFFSLVRLLINVEWTFQKPIEPLFLMNILIIVGCIMSLCGLFVDIVVLKGFCCLWYLLWAHL